jgi:hypothetical protein
MLVPVGCGGSSTTTSVQTVTSNGAQGAPTKAEYIKEADAICTQFRADTKDLFDEIQQFQVTSTEDLHKLADLIRQGVPKLQEEAARLRQLQPPGGDEAIINNYLSTGESAVSLLSDTADAADHADVSRLRELGPELTSLSDKAQGIAQGYGFKVCGSER